MKRILPRTFFWQLVLGTLVAQSLFLGVFIWYTVTTETNAAQIHTRARMVQQLDRLAAACSNPLAAGDPRAVHDVLELSRIAPTIHVARLTDLKGNTIAVSDNGRDHGLDPFELKALSSAAYQQQVFKIRNGQIEAVTPVLRNGHPVALLWLEPNHAPSLNTVNMVVRIAVDYGILALLANILPIFLIVRSMTRPLRSLSEATKNLVRTGDLETGFPLPVITSNEAGELTTSFNHMVQDLHEQRSGLLETLALLDSMLGNAPIGFAFFDRDLRYVRLNHSFAEICDSPVTDYVGLRISDICAPHMAGPMQASLKQVFKTGEAVRNVELSPALPDSAKSARTWLLHSYPVRTQQDTIRWVGVIAVEITDRLKAEEALRKTEKLAAAGRLAASIAHEINNPLEAVTNLLYLLGTHEPMDSTALHFVHAAQSELARVSEITQQTLRFYRQPTLPTQTNIGEVLDSVVTLYQPRISAAHVTVVRNFRGAPEVFGFGGELRQLFANLIGNAIDAMPQGGRLLLSVRHGNGRSSDGTWCPGVRVCVNDTGTGMSPHTVQRIFEAFFTTKDVTGTGLGLWVSHEIIAKHAGTVRVRSTLGPKSGTCFMLFFPDRGLNDRQAQQRSEQRATTPVPADQAVLDAAPL